MSVVFVGLGSNLDNPVAQVNKAIDRIKTHSALSVNRVSSLYRSAPWGVLDQGDFINAAICFTTELSPQDLLKELQAIERIHKRKRLQRFGPRTLDLDILLFGDLEIDSPELTIPHLYLMERDFVVYPLLEIAPELVLPNGLTIQQVMCHCPRGRLEKIT